MEVRISAVIITYNEEKNIRRCLESLEGVADEIIVVDSYSTDRTEEICKPFGVKFIRHRFFGHIEQKNWAILQASSSYILSMDADEALSKELRSSILKVKKDWSGDGFLFSRLNSYCGKWIRSTSWYPDRKLRLWDSRLGAWGGMNPHDIFILKKGSTQKRLKGDLLHYTYYSVSEHVEQINSFSTIISEAYFKSGKRSRRYRILLNPLWRFFKDYIVKRGFMDGHYGFVISVNSAYEVFLKYVKLKNLHKNHRRSQKQTICLFNLSSDWGGGEKWHVDVASYLVKRGDRVFYISSGDSPLAKRMNEIGVPGYHISIANLGFLNPIRVLKLRKIFRKEKVGAVVTSLPNDMKVASIAARLAKVPNIIYRRGSAIPIRNTILNRHLLRKVVSHIIANSLEVKRTILANNSRMVPEEKISILYNGVNLAMYSRETAPLYSARDKEIVLGSAGRLSEEKGHSHLLDLMKILKKSKYRFKLLIAGMGKELGSLEKKVEELGMEDRVEFLGFVEEMPAFYNSLDVFILPSRYEGFSNALIEAMACEKPVITFDVGSTAEVIEHGVTGYIGELNRVDQMAEWILELTAHPSLRKEMGVKARQEIETSFSFESGIDELLTILTR